MARSRDSRVEDALRCAATTVAYVGNGVWSLSIANGVVVPARARMSNDWLEVTARLPDSALSLHDDLSWLRLNALLEGSVRVARVPTHRIPHLRADAYIAHEQDFGNRVRLTFLELSDALQAVEGSPHDAIPPLAVEASRSTAADIARACDETGWPCVVGEGGGIRVDIETRAGVCAARLESSPTDTERMVVELPDLAGHSPTSRRAVAALLMTLSGSVRSVKGVLRDHDGATVAALVSPVAGPLDRSLDRALSALAVACHISGREVEALRDERLAAEYLALWNAASQHDSQHDVEEEICLQQL